MNNTTEIKDFGTLEKFLQSGVTVDVNLEEVIGHTVGCHRSYTKDGREYQAIDVFKSNW